MSKSIDILCVGEVLIDFIGHQSEKKINETKDYHRYLGGSPTNVAMNTARLGLNTFLISTVGKDGFGDYVLDKLNAANVKTDYVQVIKDKPTSVIFVSRTSGTPDFIPFREADCVITESQISTEALKSAKVFHTTCFALSKKPAQTTIIAKAEEAYRLGCKLSIDLNFANKLWDNKEEAVNIIQAYCKYKPLLKISEDDMRRFFGEILPHDEIFTYFHNAGVDLICLTLGSKGVKLSQRDKEIIEMPAVKIDKVLDATGAGDAFWSGFLYAYIQKMDIEKCLKIALNLAALKLQNVGRLPEEINLKE
ncbi:carbohydrate kinase family protein [Polaribacter sp. MED152]|uniref:carbohydrate kinase family protein n=1 Tax=Polaribacter sp. MED152 TaxID=313598 RepID=UPI000068C64B|nr:pfkB family carbohydrate kinase [Polaribacter sp. MED152]